MHAPARPRFAQCAGFVALFALPAFTATAATAVFLGDGVTFKPRPLARQGEARLPERTPRPPGRLAQGSERSDADQERRNRNPHRNGSSGFEPVPPGVPNLSELLMAHGYYTASFNKGRDYAAFKWNEFLDGYGTSGFGHDPGMFVASVSMLGLMASNASKENA